MNVIEAAKYYKLAADQNHARAQFNYGSCLAQGKGVPVDLIGAATYFKLAADQNHAQAQFSYGFCLEHALGVERNASMCFEFYQESARQLNVSGVSSCALSLQYGLEPGDDVDLGVAALYYGIVREQNPDFAAENCSRCCRALNRRPPPRRRFQHDRSPMSTTSKKTGNQGEVDDLLFPSAIMSYRVEPIESIGSQVIGEGSHGKVTLEHDPRDPRKHIAVKQLVNPHYRKEFIREIQHLFKLRHPCIIAVYGWSPGHSHTFQIQLEYAQNGALSNYLTRQGSAYRMSFGDPTRKAQLICDIVLGMRYVHQRKIVHRDLKPANIFLDANWRAFIGDFSLSRSITAEGPPTPEAGTPYYAAPEQMIPGRQYTGKVDVFAFGLMLYEILGNVPVFPAGRSDRLPNIPDAFGPVMQNLIHLCWSLNPRDRPSFADIFREFERCGFAIVQGADATQISQAVSAVIQQERHLSPS
jgi:hypothetical protein